MLMFFGILGFLQTTILPALLIIRLFRLKGGLTEQLLRLLPLSLTANYLVIFALAALHLYTRPIVLLLIGIEILAILWVFRKSLIRPTNETIDAIGDSLRSELQPIGNFLSEDSKQISGWIWAVSGCLALSGVLWGMHLVRLNIGTVFSGWDTVFSWNYYANTWAAGRIPNIGGMYPQLVPSNWSLSYLLQGDGAVQFFNTLIPPLFFLLIQGMLFDLGFQRRESAYFFAAIIARYMMKKLMGDQLFDGYMDVPAAAMSLLSVYTFMKAEGKTLHEQKQAIIFGVLFAAEASITKQSGFIALLLAPLTAVLLLRDGSKALSKQEKLLLAVSVLLIVLPWYLHCFFFNTHGQARELIAEGIMDYNTSYDISHRLWQADQVLGKYRLCFLFSLIGLPFVPKRYRLLFPLFIWPLTIIWAISYSYDARNLCLTLPFVALLDGLILSGFGNFSYRILQKLHADRLPVFLIGFLFLATAVIALIRLYPDEKLKEDQRNKQKALFGERLNNELLYGFFGEEHSGNDIYTDYPAHFLPGYEDCCSSAQLTDENQVKDALEGEKINWMLLPMVMPNHTDPSKELIEQCLFDGKCEQILCSDGYYKSYCLYRINRE